MPFDILDATKVVPEELVPIQIVGKMTLNRNPDNFFAETEQVAFLPTNMPARHRRVGGPTAARTALLLSRHPAFASGHGQFPPDPDQSRQGLPVPELPARRPHADERAEGPRQLRAEQPERGRRGRWSNAPIHMVASAPPRSRSTAPRYGCAPRASPTITATRGCSFARNRRPSRRISRARSCSSFRKSRSSTCGRVLWPTWAMSDADLAARVAKGLAMDLPNKSEPAAAPQDMEPSPGLRIIGKYPETLKGRKVAILVSEGADAALLEKLKAGIVAAEATPFVVAPKVGGVPLKGGTVKPDGQLAGSPSVLFDAVALVLSAEGCSAAGQGQRRDRFRDECLRASEGDRLHGGGRNRYSTRPASSRMRAWSHSARTRPSFSMSRRRGNGSVSRS